MILQETERNNFRKQEGREIMTGTKNNIENLMHHVLPDSWVIRL